GTISRVIVAIPIFLLFTVLCTSPRTKTTAFVPHYKMVPVPTPYRYKSKDKAALLGLKKKGRTKLGTRMKVCPVTFLAVPHGVYASSRSIAVSLRAASRV